MGAWAAEIFAEHGGKVLAVSDAGGAVYNEKGLDVLALRRHLAGKNPLSTFPEGAANHRLPQHTCTLLLQMRNDCVPG